MRKICIRGRAVPCGEPKEAFSQTYKWKVVKTTFLVVFVVCTVSTHSWLVIYGIAPEKARNYFGNWFFILRSFFLAVTMDYLIANRKRVSSLVVTFEATANAQRMGMLTRTKVFLVTVNVAFVCLTAVTISQVFQMKDVKREYVISKLCFGYGNVLPRGAKTFVIVLNTLLFHLNTMLLVLWLPLVYCALVKVVLNEVAVLKGTIRDRTEDSSLQLLLEQTGSRVGVVRGLVNQVNRCLGTTVLVWCGSSLIATCQGITETYDIVQSNPVWESLTVMFAFFAPSLVLVVLSAGLCSRVASEVQAAMELLQETSNAAGRQGLASQLHLLLHRMSVPELALSGGGCSTINRQFCLSYVCLLVSYLTVVYKLPSKKD